MKRAVFLDRDGTVIELVHHLTDPAAVRLLPGAAEAVRRLRQSGFACVLVSNQSVVGRGLITLQGLEAVHAELARQLAEHGAELDGVYSCPLVPGSDDPTKVEHPDRKPGPGMLLRAARELDLDVARSFMVGDTISDLLAGRNAGCQATILVKTGYGQRIVDPGPAADYQTADLWSAHEIILSTADGMFQEMDKP